MHTVIQEHLLSMQDLEYREFHTGILNGTKYELIGIRLPKLRDYAKELMKDNVIPAFKDEYYDEVMLHGFCIGLYKCSYEEKIKLIEEFVPLIDNWAINDSFASSLKFIKKYRKEFFNEIKKYVKSNEEFSQRFGLTVLLDHYVDKEYQEELYKIIKTVKYNGYYSKMAGAWLLSYCFMAFFEETIEYVGNNSLDEFVYKKGIQKALDSYRLTKQQKDILRALN